MTCSGIQTDICIKPLSRQTNGRKIERNGAYEKLIVNSVLRALEAHPSAVFLDIGANIGMYTVVAAAMKRKVISVDADAKNLAYIRKALVIAKKTDYVDLIHNAIRLTDGAGKIKYIDNYIFQ